VEDFSTGEMRNFQPALTAQEYSTKKHDKSPEIKAATSVARATWWIVFLTFCLVIIAWFQYQEIQDSSDIMDRMNRIYRTQTGELSRQAGETTELAERTKDLADRMKDQADQTKIIANQAVVQANAARSAGRTAIDTLHISERAYLTLGVPSDNFALKQISIPIINSGHIPSGVATVVAHEATFGGLDPASETISISNVLERHWAQSLFPTIPIGAPYVVTVKIPALVQDDISNGKQGVLIVVTMTYNDGFPNSPEQEWMWCDVSDYVASTKTFSMKPCVENAGAWLQILTSLDKYPDQEYKKAN
jgi:hypothetical protein